MPQTRPIPGEAHMAFSMAGLLTAAGVFALVRRGSVKSLVPSLAFAGGYAFAGEQIRNGEGANGHALAAGLGGVLGSGMLYRSVMSGKLMPSGAVSILALVSASYHGYKYTEWTG